ncbi:hypothetical protein PSSHI_47780 [Photobacterium sp. R1]
MYHCGDYVESFGGPNGSELTGGHCGPDIDRPETEKAYGFLHKPYQESGGP